MQYSIGILLAIALAIVSNTADAAEHEVHYIGFNQFTAAETAVDGKNFDNYIRRLRPILARHEMPLTILDVVHGGSAELPASVVTIGTARNLEAFQAFFADPELQDIFPSLVTALDDHQVVFTDDPLEVGNSLTLLELTWSDSDTPGSELRAIESTVAHLYETYGVTRVSESTGSMSNRGLAAEVSPTTPPGRLVVWSMADPHGFLENSLVRTARARAAALVDRIESFWLRPRSIR